ncbi:MAG TPA: DUF423 domain-containing protein [Caulobacteraceae bacterium]|jgi:uncharacterized membrane protein YgdD (TMEM256/DUF423 family)|nr:DUF423 domain-containing protein [Caulobacteraceae bacterium]
MTAQTRAWLTLAALSGLVAVAAGAFGAHGVQDLKAKDWLRTGSEYQLAHAVAALACFPLWAAGVRGARVSAWLFLIGAALFSGSLYLMALTPDRWMVLITPLGGLVLLAGWATLAWAAFMARPTAG